MKIIFYNDDYGLTHGFTDAIIDCINFGLTNKSCVRTNGTAYNYAKRKLKGKIKQAVTGIHFNLTDGKPLNPALANSDGNFKYNFIHYLLFLNPKLKKEIKKEFEQQLKMARNDGFNIDHANSQEHVHMIPAIFEITAKICKQQNIQKIRLTNEPLYTTPKLNLNLIKHLILNVFAIINSKTVKKYKLLTSDYFYGVLHTNNITPKSVMAAILDARKRQASEIEILAHPAYFDKRDKTYTSQDIEKYVTTDNRRIETQTYLDKKQKIRRFLKKLN